MSDAKDDCRFVVLIDIPPPYVVEVVFDAWQLEKFTLLRVICVPVWWRPPPAEEDEQCVKVELVSDAEYIERERPPPYVDAEHSVK